MVGKLSTRRVFSLTRSTLEEFEESGGPTEVLVTLLSLPPVVLADLASLPFVLLGIVEPPGRRKGD